MAEYKRTIACPACGGTARVTTAVDEASDGHVVMRVIHYSCPQHDLVPERTVLALLSATRGESDPAATGSSR